MVTKKRDGAAAKALLRKAFRHNSFTYRVNIDKSGSNKAALNHFNKPGLIVCDFAFSTA